MGEEGGRERGKAPSSSPAYARLASLAVLFSRFFLTSEPVRRLGQVTQLYRNEKNQKGVGGWDYRLALNFCGSLILQIGDFLCFAGTNFCDWKRLVFLAGK